MFRANFVKNRLLGAFLTIESLKNLPASSNVFIDNMLRITTPPVT